MEIQYRNYITYTDVADYLGMSGIELYNRLFDLEIPVYRVTGDIRTLLTVNDVCKLVAKE